ncbi:MAG: GlmU family protein [Cyclobacteriaceae bacterium]
MNLIFFDPPAVRQSLKPFTLTRPVAEIRCGIFNMSRKWQLYLRTGDQLAAISYITEDYLQGKYPKPATAEALLLNAAVCPDQALAKAVKALKEGQVLRRGDQIIALRPSSRDLSQITATTGPDYEKKMAFISEAARRNSSVDYAEELQMLAHTWDIFSFNAGQIEQDFRFYTRGRSSQPMQDAHSIIYGPAEDVFFEEGVSIRASIINAENGPVYIGKNVTIHENAVIKGPCAILEGAHVNIGSKIREATTIGPYSKLGGEVKNVVVFGNSNKGHEGFLGNSVIGEWCNFGADTNSSNLKNNYQPVNLWNYASRRFEDSGELFCGLMMGDHSKCGINTMFNTGSVIGVFANIFGAGYPPRFIPSFSWGCAPDPILYRIDKALEVARSVMQRRGTELSDDDEHILRHIFEQRTAETETN